MKKSILTASAATVTAAGIALAIATSSSGQAPAGTTLELSLPAKKARVTVLDLPPRKSAKRPSESVGDRVIMSGPLVAGDGTTAGWHYNEATIVKGRTPKTTEMSVTVLDLRDGQITAQGVFDQVGEFESLAITGGTRAYEGASGLIDLGGDENAVRFTVRLGSPPA